MRASFIFFLLFFYLCSCAQDFKKHILFLASDSLHGRAPGTTDEVIAAQYVAAQFHHEKCTVVFQQFPFHDSTQRSFKDKVNRDSAINVIGLSDFKKDSAIIICGHYDHLGYGSSKSKEIVKNGIYPGADDNASGVAMMIELAKWISAGRDFKYNFVFVAYSAHEAGLFGSTYFSNSTFYNSLKIRAVINFDMVGRLDSVSNIIRVSGASTDSTFSRVFKSLGYKQLHFRMDDENIPKSDLNAFAEKGFPVLNITTGVHDDYHRISDTENKINYQGMKRIYELMIHLISKFK